MLTWETIKVILIVLGVIALIALMSFLQFATILIEKLNNYREEAKKISNWRAKCERYQGK